MAQSITKINGKYFVTLDNSKKIEVIDPETFGSVGTILYTQAGFPRQIVAISPTEAIVSDLERQLVRIRTVEPYGEPLEYISIPRSVEYLVTVDNKIFGMTTGGICLRYRQYQQKSCPGHPGSKKRRKYQNLPDAGR